MKNVKLDVNTILLIILGIFLAIMFLGPIMQKRDY